MALLDTCFLIDVLKNKKPAKDIILELEGKEAVCVSSVTVMELWEGVLDERFSKIEKQRVEECLSGVNIIDFDSDVAKRAAEIRFSLIHNPIEPEDIMIAATALVRYEKIVTRDALFARIPGLRVLKY